MLSSETRRPHWKCKLLAATLGLGLLAGCQVQPLYGTMNGQKQSISVSNINSRVGQIVRNELVLGFGGEQTNSTYRLDLNVSSSFSGLLPAGKDNEFSAGRTTVTVNYVLKNSSTGKTLKTGSRSADAQLDLPSQKFADERAKIDAETRAARAAAILVRADIAVAISHEYDHRQTSWLN